MAQIKTVFLGSNDYSQVLRVFYQLHKVHSDMRPDYYLASDTPITRERYEQLLETPGTRIIGAMDGDKLVGMCIFRWRQTQNPLVYPHKVAYLDDICVDEKYRRQGIGEMLCQRAIDIAKKEKADSVELSVWCSNQPAIALYKKLGFLPRTMRMELKMDQ